MLGKVDKTGATRDGQLRFKVVVIDVVPYPDKLVALVGARKQNDSDAKKLRYGYPCRVRCIRLPTEPRGTRNVNPCEPIKHSGCASGIYV